VSYDVHRNLICAVSQDPANYNDAPTEGIRRVLETVIGKAIPRGEKLDIAKIGALYSLYFVLALNMLYIVRLHSSIHNCCHQCPP
jgi:hypothetical protein